MRDKDSKLLTEAYLKMLKEYNDDIHAIIMKEIDPILDSKISPNDIPRELLKVIQQKHGAEAAKATIKWMERHGWEVPEISASPAVGNIPDTIKEPSTKTNYRFDKEPGTPRFGNRLPHEQQDDDDLEFGAA